MDKITVSKGDLVATLKTNRANHKAEYDKAVEVYKERFVDMAKKFATDAVYRAANGIKFEGFGWLPVPEEHTDDFDRALQMLEWDLGETVELSTYEFAQYVQNDWGWAKSFASNTSSYLRR